MSTLPSTEDPPSPSHHLNIPNDDEDDDDGSNERHDHRYTHSDHNTPTQDAIIDVLAHLHPQPQSNDDASEDTGYPSYSHHHQADPTARGDELSGQSANAAADTTTSTPPTTERHTTTTDLGSTKPVSLKGWSKPQLRDEVLRLRRLLASQSPALHDASPHNADANIDPTLLNPPSSNAGPSTPVAYPPPSQTDPSFATTTAQAGGSVDAGDADLKTETRRKRKAKEEIVRDGETGKRVERSRRTELGKALRNKMRICMGITEKDPLPPPSLFTAETTDQIPELAGYGVPNWLVPGEANNTVWVDRMANEIMHERARGQHLSIPLEDMDPEVVKAASRTAFVNFCRKYQSDNDPEGGAKRSKYQKGRRRWARKDLKQKKRAKAALDPAFTNTLPPSALHLDYMSSEYSSAGPDTESEDDQPADGDEGTTKEERRQAKKAAREQRWAEEVAKKVAALGEEERENWGVFGFAQGEKVLEIRCPRWRSQQLEDTYKRLDDIAAVHASRRSGSNVDNGSRKSGHIAPSHSRFTMRGAAARRGKAPRQGGEGWMWQSGQVGQWPAAAPLSSGAGDERKVDVGDTVSGPTLGADSDDTVGEVNTLQDLAGLGGDDQEHHHGHWRDGHGDAETGALVDALVGMVADHE